MQNHTIIPVFGCRALPVTAGHVGDAVVTAIFIKIEISIAELVGDFCTRSCRSGITFGVKSAVDSITDQRGISILIHAAFRIFYGVAFLCKEIIDSIVCISSGCEIVIALGQNIGFGVISIIGCKLSLIDRDRHTLALTRLQQIGLIKAD